MQPILVVIFCWKSAQNFRAIPKHYFFKEHLYIHVPNA